LTQKGGAERRSRGGLEEVGEEVSGTVRSVLSALRDIGCLLELYRRPRRLAVRRATVVPQPRNRENER